MGRQYIEKIGIGFFFILFILIIILEINLERIIVFIVLLGHFSSFSLIKSDTTILIILWHLTLVILILSGIIMAYIRIIVIKILISWIHLFFYYSSFSIIIIIIIIILICIFIIVFLNLDFLGFSGLFFSNCSFVIIARNEFISYYLFSFNL